MYIYIVDVEYEECHHSTADISCCVFILFIASSVLIYTCTFSSQIFFDSLLMRRGTQHHLMEGSNNYGASICSETRRNILCGPALNSFFSTPARKILRN